jgi:membrane-associated phospholipid phosphatase
VNPVPMKRTLGRPNGLLGLAVFLVAACSVVPAGAAEPAAGDSLQNDTTKNNGVVWQPQWRRVGWVEYVAAPVVWGTTFTVHYIVTPHDHADWDQAILFDSALRDSMRFDSSAGRARAAVLSDVALTTAMVYPFAVDAALVSWGVHGSPDVAWQLTVIDAQALGTASMLSAITKRSFARLRPYGTDCDGVSEDQDLCDNQDRFRSFFSGHAGTTATTAGLTCAHHANLDLYGGGAGDTAACVGTIGLSLFTGAMRIAGDKHWGTDVVVGSAVGFATGYLMPTLLYYHDAPSPATDSAWRWAVVPYGNESSAGARWVGVF